MRFWTEYKTVSIVGGIHWRRTKLSGRTGSIQSGRTVQHRIGIKKFGFMRGARPYMLVRIFWSSTGRGWCCWIYNSCFNNMCVSGCCTRRERRHNRKSEKRAIVWYGASHVVEFIRTDILFCYMLHLRLLNAAHIHQHMALTIHACIFLS